MKLWDIDSGECLCVLKGHRKGVRDITFSPDGRLLASASRDKTVKIWDIKKEECLFTLKGNGSMMTVSFSSDGKLLASEGLNNTIRIWDVKTGQLKNLLKGHDYNIYAVDFNPNDNSLLASGDYNGYIKLWDIEKGECTFTTDPIDKVRDLQFFPNGNYLASLHYNDEDSIVNIWKNV